MQALVLQDVKKIYANGVTALKGIDLTVEEREFYGILGPNGAGKSTTIGIIASLINKSSGNVKIFDIDLDDFPEKARLQLGLVPQEFNFNMFEKVIDIVTNQAGYYGVPYSLAKQRAEYYLKKLQLWDKAMQPARFLSGGLKRRLMMVRALIHEPKLLILDEPTAGVDIELRRTIWDFLRELNETGVTIILTTHYLEEAENLCKKIAIINHGEIIEQFHVKQLIQKLHVETLVLDLKTPLGVLPQLEGFTFHQVDDYTLEAMFNREASLEALFFALAEQGCKVLSLKNKANRLEELFIKVIQPK